MKNVMTFVLLVFLNGVFIPKMRCYQRQLVKVSSFINCTISFKFMTNNLSNVNQVDCSLLILLPLHSYSIQIKITQKTHPFTDSFQKKNSGNTITNKQLSIHNIIAHFLSLLPAFLYTFANNKNRNCIANNNGIEIK